MLVWRVLPKVSHKIRLGFVDFKLICAAVGVLRMVKLFGWEKKMSDNLQQTRDEELYWLFKEKVGFFLMISSSQI